MISTSLRLNNGLMKVDDEGIPFSAQLVTYQYSSACVHIVDFTGHEFYVDADTLMRNPPHLLATTFTQAQHEDAYIMAERYVTRKYMRAEV